MAIITVISVDISWFGIRVSRPPLTVRNGSATRFLFFFWQTLRRTGEHSSQQGVLVSKLLLPVLEYLLGGRVDSGGGRGWGVSKARLACVH